MKRRRVLLSWSSGKDSAWALHVLRDDPGVEVVGLLTTINERFDRVAMHAVRREVLEAQAESLGLPLILAGIPYPCSNERYAEVMGGVVARAVADGVTDMAFGDLFLQDVRAYREERLAGTGLSPLFPLWNLPTAALVKDMLGAGVVAHLTAVDPSRLPVHFAGRRLDETLLAEFPADVDPCGENGEFHTFVSAGPMFRRPLDVRVGERVERDGFAFCDLLLAGS